MGALALTLGGILAAGYGPYAIAQNYNNFQNTGVLNNPAGNSINATGWIENGSNASNTGSTLTNSGTMSSGNWFSNGSGASYDTNISTNYGTMSSANWFENGSGGSNDSNTLTNYGTISSQNFFENGSGGSNNVNTLTNNGTISSISYVQNGDAGSNNTDTLINYGTISASSLTNSATLMNSGVIESNIVGTGSFTQSGGSLVLGYSVNQTSILVEGAPIVLDPSNVDAGNVHNLAGRSFDILSAGSISINGIANPTITDVKRFFNLTAFQNNGLSTTFSDTFQGNDLVDVSVTFEQAPPQTYTVKLIPALGAGGNLYAQGVNGDGRVTGTGYVKGGFHQAFMYISETGSIGGLGGESDGGSSRGLAINDHNWVTGYSDTATASTYAAFLWSNGKWQNLGTLGGAESAGYGINDSHEVVGWANVASSARKAFFYTDGIMQDLGTLGGDQSQAYGINDTGQIVGQAQDASTSTMAFLYTNGVMQSLGTLGGTNSVAFAINDSGQVAGSAETPSGVSHAFLYNAGVMEDLGTLGGSTSEAYAINVKGQVVGSADAPTGTHAFLYSKGQMLDLNSLIPSNDAAAYTLTSAVGINKQGTIVVQGYINSNPGYVISLLLTPNQP